MFEKIKEFIKEHREEIILVIGVILISLLSFAIGYITAKQEEKEPIKIEKFQAPSTKFQTNSNDQNSKLFGFLGD
jgi:predicted negative regulator of RcsB-dependent stress response